MFQKIREEIADADMVLLGIGEELEIQKSNTEGKENQNDVMKRTQFYQQLSELIKDKNYFVVTLCMDGLIRETPLDQEHIVEPCGSFYKLQCRKKCTSDIYKPDDHQKRKIREYIEGRCQEKDIDLPVCPKCGEPLVFNTILTENYAEEGYLDTWQIYNKWLQGTINRKLCILEFGVGMRFPTVIRWPFEKITYFNHKAFLFRIHSKLYQVTKEISERSIGIEANPVKYMEELCDQV